MPNITYQLRAAYASNFTGAVINVDDTRSYDVGAALTAGSGTITTPDTDSHLIAVLDAFPALMRTGSTPTPPVPPPPPQTMRRLRLGRGSDPGETVLQAGRDTDVFNRFELTVDGALKTGDGTAAPAPLSAGGGRLSPTGNAGTDTAAINNALLTNGLAVLGEGTFVVDGSLNLAEGSCLVLDTGWELDMLPGTVIQLAAGSNRDILRTKSFHTLTGTAGENGPSRFRINGGRLDGNRANNTSGVGLQVYGFNYRIEDFEIGHCAGKGFTSEWASGGSTTDQAGAMETVITGLKVYDCNAEGVDFNGPHDSTFNSSFSFRNCTTGQSQASWKLGLKSFGTRLNGCYSWSINSDWQYDLKAHVYLNNCTGEVCQVGIVRIDHASEVVIKGGSYFCITPTSIVGIQLGGPAGGVGACHVDTHVSGCRGGAVNFSNSNGGNRVTMSVYQDTGTALVGTRNTGDLIDLTVSGGAARGTRDRTNSLVGNAQTANYTLALADFERATAVDVNAAGAVTITVPPNSSVAVPTFSVVEITRLGAGAVTIAPGAGVTLRSRGGLLNIGNQYGAVSLRKIATDEWIVIGDLA